MSVTKIAIGVVAGMAAGAITAMLTAPDSGRNTRRKISQTGQSFVSDVQCKVNDFTNGFKSSVKEVKDEAHQMMDPSKTKTSQTTRKPGYQAS